MIYIYKNSIEVKLRLTAGRTIELEERTGKAVPELVKEIDKLGIITEILAAAIDTADDYKIRKDKALGIYDDMISREKNITDIQLMVFEVLKDAGFLTAQRVEILKKMVSLQEQLLSKSTDLVKNTEATLNISET